MSLAAFRGAIGGLYGGGSSADHPGGVLYYPGGGGGGGYNPDKDCCELVVDPLTFATLMAFILGGTAFLNTLITMNIGRRRRRRRRRKRRRKRSAVEGLWSGTAKHFPPKCLHIRTRFPLVSNCNFAMLIQSCHFLLHHLNGMSRKKKVQDRETAEQTFRSTVDLRKVEYNDSIVIVT